MSRIGRIIFITCILVLFSVAAYLHFNNLGYSESFGDYDTPTSDYTTTSLSALFAGAVVLYMYILAETREYRKRRNNKN